MLDVPRAGGTLLEILARQRTVDAERGPRALARGHDRELYVTDDVARHENARHAGGFVLSAKHAAVRRELAAHRLGQVRLQGGTGVQEQPVAGKPRTIREFQRRQPAAPAAQSRNALLADADRIAR